MRDRAERPAGPCGESQAAGRGSGAWFAAGRGYRYALWRIWEPALGVCNFVMLNPSTADETHNDPTIERCQRRALAWGYGGLVVTNLFALCTTDPARLRRVADPVGAENDSAVIAAARCARLVVCGWGNQGAYLDRARAVLALLASHGVTPCCLKVTKSRQPTHPLYLGYDQGPRALESWPEAMREPRRPRAGVSAGSCCAVVTRPMVGQSPRSESP